MRKLRQSQLASPPPAHPARQLEKELSDIFQARSQDRRHLLRSTGEIESKASKTIGALQDELDWGKRLASESLSNLMVHRSVYHQEVQLLNERLIARKEALEAHT